MTGDALERNESNEDSRSDLGSVVEDRIAIHGRVLGRRLVRAFARETPGLRRTLISVGLCISGLALWGLALAVFLGEPAAAGARPYWLLGTFALHGAAAVAVWLYVSKVRWSA